MTLSVAAWQQEATDLAMLMRLGRNVEAGLRLADYLEMVLTDFQKWPDVEINRQLPQLLAAILACQEKQDWLGLADYLDYELQQLFQAVAKET